MNFNNVEEVPNVFFKSTFQNSRVVMVFIDFFPFLLKKT